MFIKKCFLPEGPVVDNFFEKKELEKKADRAVR
jgi:hypothetical protein